MARRKRSDSVDAQIQASFGNNSLQWPAAIAKADGAVDAIFAGILSSRTAADWREHDLVLAAQLANCHLQADRVFQELCAAGFLINRDEEQIKHPLVVPWRALQATILSLTTKLRLSVVQDSRTTANRASVNPAVYDFPPLPVLENGELDYKQMAKDLN